MDDDHAPGRPADERLMPVERLAAFTDAVVAIAMTLLILPLLDEVSQMDRSAGTAAFVQDNLTRLGGFVLSFAIIAAFWRRHHRVFSRIEMTTETLVRIDVAWMFAIVWLPVATALVGAMPVDRLQGLLYVGPMCLAAWTMVAIGEQVSADPRLRGDHPPADDAERASALVTAVLFTASLLVIVIWPGASYFPLLLLLVTGPLARVTARRLRRARR